MLHLILSVHFSTIFLVYYISKFVTYDTIYTQFYLIIQSVILNADCTLPYAKSSVLSVLVQMQQWRSRPLNFGAAKLTLAEKSLLIVIGVYIYINFVFRSSNSLIILDNIMSSQVFVFRTIGQPLLCFAILEIPCCPKHYNHLSSTKAD